MELYQEKVSEPTFKIYRGNTIPDNKYLETQDGWKAIATIEVTGKRIWAAWMAGGSTEPDPDNYVILSYSDDGGKNWVLPFITIDNDSPLSRGRDPVLWCDPRGVLWLYYGFYALKYTYAIKIENPEADVNDMIIHEPVVKFKNGVLLNKPIVTSKGEWLCSFDPRMEDRQTNYCLYSDDYGETWKKRGEMHTDSARKDWQEGALVEKADGSLWALLRIENAYNGGIEQCFSFDDGYTWTNAEYNLSYPFYGAGSKFCMRRLSSGNLLFVNNNSTNATRVNMSAYLSRDDGISWKALLLDGRSGCAYPDAAQDENGNIYVIFDCDRKEKYEIRFCKFTEQDMLSGGFVSKNSINMAAIIKSGKYKDIVKIKSIANNRAEVVDENNNVYTLNGSVIPKTVNNLNYEYFDATTDLLKYGLTDAKNLLLSVRSK